MRVLVTGATGMIGRAVVSSLIRDGERFSVVAVSRSKSVPDDWDTPTLRLGRVLEWRTLSNSSSWVDLCQGVDVVVHCAARAHVLDRKGATDRDAFVRDNVGLTEDLAAGAARAGVRRLVFLSTIGVHGAETTSNPLTECSPLQPADVYAWSKLLAEQALADIGGRAGLEWVIIRPPLVYGPNAKGNFAAMIRWIKRGVPLPLGCVSKNRRSLVGLDNLVDLIRVCIEHPAAGGQAFVVADGDDVSTADLVRRTASAMGCPARLWPVPLTALKGLALLTGRRDWVRRLLGSLQVDARKARDQLGWRPTVPLDEGLRRATRSAAGK